MGHRIVAGVAATVSAAVLAGALVAVAGDGGGVSDRRVDAFGLAPTVAAEALLGAVPQPAVAGADLAPVPEVDEAPSVARAVPVRSGWLDALAAERPPEPVQIVIGDIAVNAPVDAVGYDARRDEMEVPRRAELVGWYRFGVSPGQQGSAVLAAHVDFNGRAGAFFGLHTLEAGASIVVVMDDGSRQRWEVVAKRQYGKELLPADAIFREHGEPTLALITCGGPFDGRRYEDNVVVFARPAGAPAGEPGPA